MQEAGAKQNLDIQIYLDFGAKMAVMVTLDDDKVMMVMLCCDAVLLVVMVIVMVY